MTHDRAHPIEGEDWLRLLAGVCSEGVLVHEGGRILRVNETLAGMLGYEPDEMVGRMGSDFTVPEDRRRLMEHIARESEEPLEGTALRKDGFTIPVHVLGRNAVVGGRTLRVVVMRDLTRQRQAEARLREQEARYRMLVKQLPAVVWTTDTALRVTAIEGIATPAVADPAQRPARLGRPLAEAMAHLAQLGQLEQLMAAHERALAGESGGYRVRTDRVVFEAHVEPLRDPETGRVTGVIGVAIDISAQVVAAERASRSEQRLHEIAEHVREVMSVTELLPVPRLAYVNPAFESIFGMPVADAYANPLLFIERIHEEDRERVRAAIGRMAETGNFAEEYRVVHTDGTVRWLSGRGYPVYDAGGRLVRTVGIAEDITARRTAEAALRQSRRELLALTENSPDIFTRYDREHRVRFMSKGVERATGVPYSWFLGRSIHEFGYPSELTARWVAANERVFATGEPEEEEFEFPAPDGMMRTYHVRIVPELDETGAVEFVLTNTRDITERKRAEAAAKAADATLRSLVEQSLTGIYVIQDGIFRYVNPRLAGIFGYESPEAVLALPGGAADLVHPDDRALVAENLRRRTEGDLSAMHYTFRGVRRDGSPIDVEVYGGVAEHDGRPAVVGTLLDITDHVRAQAALQASEERFRALVEHTSDLIAILDPDGTNRYASPSHEVVLGTSPEAIRGRSCFEFVHPEERGALRQAFDEAMHRPPDAPPPPPHLFRFRHQDGSYRSLMVLLRDQRHTPAVGGIVANSRDVTEYMRLEEQLRQAQKMEAMGQLAGGVAHDFNNILAAITGYAQLLRAALPAGDPRREDAQEIVVAAARGAAVTKQLLAFSRRQAIETDVLDLAEVVHATGRMLRPLLPAAIALVLPEPGAGPPALVRASRAQLEQIILNLAVNARDAMPEGGTLAFAVTSRHTGSFVAGGASREAVLVVRDTGSGIPEAIQDRIFDPFFTTKPPGRGTGLGLATVYGLVRQFGGSVAVESREGAGTTFTIALPLVAPPASGGAAAGGGADGGGNAEGASPARDGTGAAAAAATAAPRRILVVEDEPQVRAITMRALTVAGFAVAESPDGAAALERLRAGEPFDLVLTDAAMPALGGPDLAAAIAALRPGLPVVLMSGYTELSGAGVGAQLPGVSGFIEKPFTMAHLVEVVRGAIDASR